ncbi:hypothetical protein THAOC_12296 [Thalassiosira oceanica]|uniref:RING-type E3 ubiquitin transferase n=1 Tax=Thalassiosira oceanica TaxID=159749 RepID=K0SP54_THAOC|nr:hypothetical protein THAOC_12296 [Thalassiosira oceanica]|eukprot:EJK66754.1 hypothetical protein THAOC_12296 [Thalassiosira oceanica]
MKVEGKLLLVAAAFCLQAALVQAWARTCSLEREGVHSVMVRSKSASARDDAGHGRTLGLSGRERAVLVAKHNAERKQRGDDDGAHNATVSSDLVSTASNGAVDTSTSEPPIVDDDLVPFEGRPCNCDLAQTDAECVSRTAKSSGNLTSIRLSTARGLGLLLALLRLHEVPPVEMLPWRYAEAESGEVSERDVDLSTPSLEQPLELEQTCSICLLAFEEGETVTDLTCGHLYHAECVSEWLLKKNECPLCKNPIASEVRTFNQDEDGDDEASVGRRQGLVPRLRKYTWDNFIEMATGRAVRPRLPGIPQAPV